jgi:hypothetical protein
MKQLDESEDPADEVALDARFASLNSMLNSKKFRFEIRLKNKYSGGYQAMINSAQAV